MALLEKIYDHTTLATLPAEQLPVLAAEIRERLLTTVSRTGGHLAANLGVVELTIALERCYDASRDRIIWDVGHQSYVHKILTGRNSEFDSLRQAGGLSGFPSPSESPCDAYISGHAGNALSAASGIAAGFKLAGRRDKVIAVVGDASISCGISLEALNHAARTGGNMLMILNDNSMAISKTVGGVATHLTNLIAGKRYNSFKNSLKKVLGEKSKTLHILSRMTDILKYGMIPTSVFETLGIRYFGPIDGHDIREMEKIFRAVSELKYPVIVHVVTKKGKGYAPAETDPAKFHGISPQKEKDTGLPCPVYKDFSAAFGDKLTVMAGKDDKICAITAGMLQGTGLGGFAEKYPDRFFDVGIAEEHAAIFAGGLAVSGMKPVLALYSSFLQRSFDCLFQDISLAGAGVVLAIDRAGAVEDGPTHHGLRDIALLRTLKNFMIMAPADGRELEMMLDFAMAAPFPAAIRYPRGVPPANLPSPQPLESGRAAVLAEGSDCAIWAIGRECSTALTVRDILAGKGISAKVINARFAAPFDKETAVLCAEEMPVFTLEDHMLDGGLFSLMTETLATALPSAGYTVHGFGWDKDPGHGNVDILKQKAGLDAESISESITGHIKSQRG